MTLHQTIKEHTKQAMIAKDELKTMVLRGVSAEIQRELIAKKSAANEGTDEELIAVIKRLVKQRKDSIDQFTRGGRPELAENEEKELAILSVYLPAVMSLDDIEKIVRAKQMEIGVTDKSDMGKLIGAVSKELKGAADGSDIKTVVERVLG